MRRKWLLLTGLFVFLLSACGNEKDMEESVVDNSFTGQKGIEYYGTYDQNDLKIEAIETEVADVQVEIPQIDGLADNKLQSEINQDIHACIQKATEQMTELNFLSYTTMSNFSNVLSISVYYGSDDFYDQIYLNYNLKNGERIQFEDLFYEDTDTLELIREAFYTTLILNEMTANIDENELYKIVKAYSGSEEKEFAFTPSKIYVYYKDYVSSINMIEHMEEISIYSRYLTDESLYTGEYEGRKNIMTCVDIPEDAFEHMKFGYLYDNCWCDITIMREYIEDISSKEKLDRYQAFKENRYKAFDRQIQSYAEIAKSNPENFYIVISKPSFWREEYGERVHINENITMIEMTMETYEKVYKDKLLEAYRYDYLALAGGIYLYTEDSQIQTKQFYNEKVYNYMTGEEVE